MAQPAAARWARDGLVAAQTAMALVLLIGAGLLMRSFLALRSVDPGYDTRDVFTFQFAPEQAALKDGPSWARFHLEFLERLARAPGRDFGRDRRERAPRRRHARRSLPQRGHAGGPGRRTAPQLDVRRRRLLPDDGASTWSTAGRSRPPTTVGARERGDQPLGGEPALPRTAGRRAAACSSRDRRPGTRSWASWKT